MKVVFYGPVGQPTGYGRCAADYCMALAKAGVDVTIVPPVDITDADLDQLDRRYEPLLERFGDIGIPDVVIVHALPFACASFLEDLKLPKSVLRCALTTFETEAMSQSAIDSLEESFDLVLVPSTYNERVFKRQMRTPEKCVVVPHTFDPAHWDRAGSQPSNADYTFYTILTWCERKNPIGLLKAYLTEFTEKDSVLLKIKTPGYNVKEVQDLVSMLKIPYLPPVELLCEPLNQEEMLALHTSSDVYVTTSRAEGWGLGSFEARLLGNSVIAPAYSGHLDFLWASDTVKLVPYFLTPAVTPATTHNKTLNVHGLEIKPILRADHMSIGGDMEWAEVDLHTTKKYLRQAYEENWAWNDNDRAELAKRFSYETVGQLILKTFTDALNNRQI